MVDRLSTWLYNTAARENVIAKLEKPDYEGTKLRVNECIE